MQDANELAHAIIDVVKAANTLIEALKQYEASYSNRQRHPTTNSTS